MRSGQSDEDFRGCLAGNLRAATRVVTRLYDDALRASGLRITQVAILAQVRRGQPMAVTELATNLSAERSAVARDVRVLEREGLVRTVQRASDLRVREVCLTESGAQRLREAAPAWQAAQAHARTHLGAASVDALTALAGEVVRELSEEARTS